MYSPPENLSLHSIESSQGYQDSDESIGKTYVPKKRTYFTLPSYRSRSRKRSRTKSALYISDDSSNSIQSPPLKSMIFQNSTLKSDVYKSESYQSLMNNNVTLRNKCSSQLEKIEESSPLSIDLQYVNHDLGIEDKNSNISKGNRAKDNLNTDSSSNVTLPTSPVLSIVENISISKSLLNNSNDFQLEEDQNDHVMLNELMRIEDDVSLPLMQRQCSIESTAQDGKEYHYNLNVPNTTAVSETFLNKVNTVNLKDPTLSESIQIKMKELLLESSKKVKKRNDTENEETLGTKQVKPKKRSSTPRKRQNTRKLKLTNNEPCIEEEHMETCSCASRKSCPPMLQVFEQLTTNEEINNSKHKSKTDKPEGRKKKDIIKVKIVRPKHKKLNKETIQKSTQNIHESVQGDSGINDTESCLFINTDDSVDLIHNHSETCLNANECLGDSVEIIPNASKSIISLESNSNSADKDISHNFSEDLPEKMTYEFFSHDAQDVSILQKVIEVSEYRTTETTTVYHTPLGSLSPPDSLITEDLSDEGQERIIRSPKWYLFSEEELSNTNNFDINQNLTTPTSYGADLNQIFPITCAIPNLSTITEISKENEDNTRKFNDTNTRNDLDSPSLFNN